MNIIIVGAGEIGAHFAVALAEESHSITVIESDVAVANDLQNYIDARVLVADGTDVSVLVDAGIVDCDLFLSVTSDKNVNIVSASIAKQLGAKKTIARVSPAIERDQLFLNWRAHFAIDYIFSPERLAAVELAKFVRSPNSSLVEEIAGGFVELQGATVSAKSRHFGKPLREISFPDRIRIGVIMRGAKSFIPKAEDMLVEGDRVFLFGEPRKLAPTILEIEGEAKDQAERNVVIFGGGEYGFSVAQMLEEENCRVRIFERSRERCEALGNQLSGVTVLNADATRLSEMKEECIGSIDFFIGATATDEDNVMTCLQAHNLGARRCLSLIHRSDYADTMNNFGEALGIMAAVSPREATRKDLMRFITADRFHLLHELGGAELIEATVTEKAPVEGKQVQEVPWPDDCVLVARLHAEHGSVPKADEVIQQDDALYAFVMGRRARRRFISLVTG